jgi:hypothetical protein
MMPNQVALLRLQQKQQPSKNSYAVGFDILVKQWDKYINAGGGYVEK